MKINEQNTRQLLERLSNLAEEKGRLEARIEKLDDEMNDLKFEIQNRTKENVT